MSRKLHCLAFGCSVFSILFVFAVPPVLAGEPRLVASAARPPVTIPSNFEGKRLAVYGGGALVVAEGDMAEPSLFSVYGTDGNLLAQVPLKIPGAARVVVYDYARGASGVLAACGFAESPGAQRAPFLAWISADGSRQKVIRTEPYYPFLCTAAPDGSLWTVGIEMTPDLQEKPEHQNGRVLRRFDGDGRQLGAWLPRSSFQGTAALTHGFLAAGAERIGWLSWSVDHGLKGTYVEITPGGGISTFPLQEVPGFKSGIGAFGGMAFTAEGDLIVAAVPVDKTDSTALLLLDRSNRQWRRVSLPPAASSPFYHVYGADAELALSVGGDEKSRVRFFRLEK